MGRWKGHTQRELYSHNQVLLVIIFFFGGVDVVRVSCSTGWPGTCYVTKGDPEQLPVSVS